MIDLRTKESKEYRLFCNDFESKSLSIIKSILGDATYVSNGTHIWVFNSLFWRDRYLKKIHDYEKENNIDLEYTCEKINNGDFAMIDLRKQQEAKFDIDKEFDKVISRYNKEKKDLPGKDAMDKIEYLLSTMDYDDDEYDSLYDRLEDYFENDENCKNKKENTKESKNMLDLRKTVESKKNEDDKEIKFVNKGDEFKSDKAETVKIVDIDKKDDKTEVTYKLGDEEKKGDIEDVLKMLNGAEYNKVEDKNDNEKKESEVTEAKEDDKAGDDESKDDKEDDEASNEKKESVDENAIEVILTEDFHVPGTDIILEKGDKIQIIPRKEEN